MYSITCGYFHPKLNKLAIYFLALYVLFCSATALCAQPFHNTSGLRGYENESGFLYSGSDWAELPSFKISQVSPARINSYIALKVRIIGDGDAPGDQILIRFYNPDNEMVDQSHVYWNGNCWSLVLYSFCMGEGWMVETAHYVGNNIGLWTIETIDSAGGVENLISQQTVEVKGREMVITQSGNLTVYENQNSRVPLEVKLIDYDNTSGTQNKEINYEVIQGPKGSTSGGLNNFFSSSPNYSKRDLLNSYTSDEGLARPFWQSGSQPGVYIIKATSYWAPESVVEFQITVKQGKDPI